MITFILSQAERHQCGSIAQLGEHLPYKQRVIGSSPIAPTIFNTARQFSWLECQPVTLEVEGSIPFRVASMPWQLSRQSRRLKIFVSVVRFRPKAPFAVVAQLVECHLAKVDVASSSLVYRSRWRHSQVVRRRSAKSLFPSSNLGGASIKIVNTKPRKAFLFFIGL